MPVLRKTESNLKKQPRTHILMGGQAEDWTHKQTHSSARGIQRNIMTLTQNPPQQKTRTTKLARHAGRERQ